MSPNFISLQQAMQQLRDRLRPTDDEIAMWVALGPQHGGLAAFFNAHGLDNPPRFIYSQREGDFDYLSDLQGCYFREADLASFKPSDRFLTWNQLVERWADALRGDYHEQADTDVKTSDDVKTDDGDKTKAIAFIASRVGEHNLLDCHPVTGTTHGSNPGQPAFPPLESALFAVSQIEAIEQQYLFRSTKASAPAGSSRKSVASTEIVAAFRVVSDEQQNAQWWSTRMRDAKRYGLMSSRASRGAARRPSRWYPDQVAAWLIDKNPTSRARVVKALRDHFPEYADAAEHLA